MTQPVSTHAPHARCDQYIPNGLTYSMRFYSRTSCEVRPIADHIIDDGMSFYSRTSCEVRRRYRIQSKQKCSFYSRTSCEVRLIFLSVIIGSSVVSTHAPHARCDEDGTEDGGETEVSTHAPHARCDIKLLRIKLDRLWFLLTHLMRGATDLLNSVKDGTNCDNR